MEDDAHANRPTHITSSSSSNGTASLPFLASTAIEHGPPLPGDSTPIIEGSAIEDHASIPVPNTGDNVTFTDLPPELICMILFLTHPRDILSFSQASRACNELAMSESVWLDICYRILQPHIADAAVVGAHFPGYPNLQGRFDKATLGEAKEVISTSFDLQIGTITHPFHAMYIQHLAKVGHLLGHFHATLPGGRTELWTTTIVFSLLDKNKLLYYIGSHRVLYDAVLPQSLEKVVKEKPDVFLRFPSGSIHLLNNPPGSRFLISHPTTEGPRIIPKAVLYTTLPPARTHTFNIYLSGNIPKHIGEQWLPPRLQRILQPTEHALLPGRPLDFIFLRGVANGPGLHTLRRTADFGEHDLPMSSRPILPEGVYASEHGTLLVRIRSLTEADVGGGLPWGDTPFPTKDKPSMGSWFNPGRFWSTQFQHGVSLPGISQEYIRPGARILEAIVLTKADDERMPEPGMHHTIAFLDDPLVPSEALAKAENDLPDTVPFSRSAHQFPWPVLPRAALSTAGGESLLETPFSPSQGLDLPGFHQDYSDILLNWRDCVVHVESKSQFTVWDDRAETTTIYTRLERW